MPLTLAILTLLAWLYLATARGQFWRLRDFDDDTAKHEPPTTWPKVVAVVPARNESASIAQSLSSLLQQNYPGDFSIILVDDHSEDATSQIAAQTALNLQSQSKLQILPAPPLPPNWTGKLWALHTGTSLAASASGTANHGCAPTTSLSPTPPTTSRISPTYFWFTDADITHAPSTLQRLVSRAEKDHLDLTSLMVQLQAKTIPERLLIPAFLFFFLKLYPPSWTAAPNAKTAGAAGGCILLRTSALQNIGGLLAIRSALIDDCTLAAAIKRTPPSALGPPEAPRSPAGPKDPSSSSPSPSPFAPHCHPEAPRSSAGPKDPSSSFASHRHPPSPPTAPLWMGLTRQSLSLRPYTTFAEIQDMIARTAYTQLRHNPLLLLGTVAVMTLLYVVPITLLFAHNPTTQLLATATCLLMILLYLPTILFYRLSPLWAVTLPAAALFYTYATLLSAVRYHLGRGAQWKGRSQI